MLRGRFVVGLCLTAIAGFAAVSTVTWTHGQTVPAPPGKLPAELLIPPAQPAPKNGPQGIRPVSTDPVATPAVAPPKKKPAPFDAFYKNETLPELTRQMVYSSQAGMEWLFRYNQPHGKFLAGYLPAVNQPLEEDNTQHQAIAAFVLARSARFTGDDRFAARANQAALALLTDTLVDPAQPGVRIPAQKSIICNRLATAGFLVMTIHELPAPGADLIARAEELCAFIRLQIRDDGSLHYTDTPTEVATTVDPEGINFHPGPALYGLMLSQRQKPAAWKTEIARKAIPYYRKWFRQHPNPEMTVWMTAACTEAYALTKENEFAEFAFEMNDWLCRLQYDESPDPRKPLWRGGFMNFEKGRTVSTAPTIDSAGYVQSLADACHLLRMMPTADTQRFDKYRVALIRSVQFLKTLQFTESNALHIANNYRFMLVGGYHPTHLDGNLRIDQSAKGVSAMIQFLMNAADR